MPPITTPKYVAGDVVCFFGNDAEIIFVGQSAYMLRSLHSGDEFVWSFDGEANLLAAKPKIVHQAYACRHREGFAYWSAHTPVETVIGRFDLYEDGTTVFTPVNCKLAPQEGNDK